MNKDSIAAIRILPSDKKTFKTEPDFRYFIEKTMVSRGGVYYFPNQMMKCEPNTMVLFQYNGMIRAVGMLISAQKKRVFDERGIDYAGCYRFDVKALKYLTSPIDADTMKLIYPEFTTFNQSKQIIPLDYLDNILLAIKRDFVLEDDEEQFVRLIEKEMEDVVCEGITREAIIKCRVNQNVFRDKLLKRYSECCVCGLSNSKLLIASHIKPWSCSASTEKLDVDNGLLLCPNHDKLFDSGLITFDNSGHIIISDQLSEADRDLMNVHPDMVVALTERNREYLEYHRKCKFESQQE